MALRKLIYEGDALLKKVSKPVDRFDEKLHELLDDMAETLRYHNGVGLAAVQVGYLRRLFIIDDFENIHEFINPEIINSSGVIERQEGCLSCPGKFGITARPNRVTIKAKDRNGKPFIYRGEDIIAQAICHENDHLDGKLFYDSVIRMLDEEDLNV